MQNRFQGYHMPLRRAMQVNMLIQCHIVGCALPSPKQGACFQNPAWSKTCEIAVICTYLSMSVAPCGKGSFRMSSEMSQNAATWPMTAVSTQVQAAGELAVAACFRVLAPTEASRPTTSRRSIVRHMFCITAPIALKVLTLPTLFVSGK